VGGADVFPVAPFADALQSGFVGTPFEWSDVAVVGAWGMLGVALAVRVVTWEPRV
jgi:hypothetical protein